MVQISSPSIIHIFTHHFFPVAHPFPSLALYPHGDTEALVFSIPYVNIYDISVFSASFQIWEGATSNWNKYM